MTKPHSVVDDERLDESLLARISDKISGDEAAQLQNLLTLSKPLRALWITSTLQQTVENGGFKQYFWAFEDERFYSEVRGGFQELCAKDHLKIFERALKLIQPHLQAMRDMQGHDDYFTKYKPLLKQNGTSDKLLHLDGEFYDLRPTLTSIRAKYIRKYPEECMV